MTRPLTAKGAAIHILAERVKPRWRTTEKTRAVLPQPPGSEPAAEKAQPEEQSARTGHGRNGAARFTGARTVRVPHKTLHPGDDCPECGVGKVYRQKEPKTFGADRRAAAAGGNPVRDGATAL